MPYDNQGNLVPCRALRARGLKLVGRNVAVRVVSSRPTWARGLKLARVAVAIGAVQSRPTWARGFVGGDMAGV